MGVSFRIVTSTLTASCIIILVALCLVPLNSLLIPPFHTLIAPPPSRWRHAEEEMEKRAGLLQRAILWIAQN